MAESNERHYCMLPTPESSSDGTRAALLTQFRWQPGSRVRVTFLSGDPGLQERVMDVAHQWTGPQMANLSFQVTDSTDADIRIDFQPGNGSWSFLGTVAHQIPVSDPTMNYGWLTPDSPDDEVHRVVAHEFGHATGLIHEHQNPNRPIAWNRAAVIADLSQPPNNWDLQTIENNMFAKYDSSALMSTPTDPTSIMMYPIPEAWTTDGFSAGLNDGLSETDRELIRKAYPW